MPDDETSDALTRIEERDGTEVALEIAAAFASAAPWVGGPISNYMAGKANDRKFRRVADELKKLADDMRRVESDIAKQYVKTEEFEDLLEITMQNIAIERSEEKRKLYRAFLANTAASPGEPWAEKQRFLRTIEEIEPEHVRLLKALMQEPKLTPSTFGYGSVSQTLRTRAPEIANRIEDLSRELDRMGLTSVGQTGGIMTIQGAEDLRGRVMPYGQRFLQYVLTDS
jgi:hypothetical protein